MTDGALIRGIGGKEPRLGEGVFVAPTAVVVRDVARLG